MENKQFGEGDQRIGSGLEGLGLWEQRKPRRAHSSNNFQSRRSQLRWKVYLERTRHSKTTTFCLVETREMKNPNR